MENIYESIINRRSVRKFTDMHIEEEKLTGILRAAMNAPSACNQQPWRFVVITDKDVLKELHSTHNWMLALLSAPVTIVVCGEPRMTKLERFWRQDCSAATQNMLLAAHTMGLGAVWMGIDPAEGTNQEADSIRKILGLPEYIVPFSFVSLGYPAEQTKASDRYDESKIHYQSRW